MSTFDAIVVGGGHNGLVCAAYLARAGQRVVVLEAAAEVGGAAVTREIAAGFRVSSCAHILHQLNPQVWSDLDLERNGVVASSEPMPTIGLGADGQHLKLSPDEIQTRAEIAALSGADAERFHPLMARLRRFAGALEPLLGMSPPRLGTADWSDRSALLKLGWRVRRLGRDDMRELLRIAGSNVADLVEDTFETERLQGLLAFDAVLGTHLGPRSPTSMLTWLYRLAGEAGRALVQPVGGMGAVTQAIARAAQAAGAEIRTDTPVARILVEEDRARGVALDSGERLSAPVVVSSADPKRTFLSLLGVEHLDTGFVRRIRNLRMRGNVAKLNLALEGQPEFTGLASGDLGARLVIAPSVDYLEQAFNAAKYGEYSPAPAMEITIPSVHDSGLAPPGKHVLSALVQYAPYGLNAGWDTAKPAFEQQVLSLLGAYAPGLESLISARQLLTPFDLEREFRLTGGHWHHGELAFDQLLMLRPVPGAAQYATPLPGLYLCGAGSHPGGGVMGAAGMNAAREVIAREVGE